MEEERKGHDDGKYIEYLDELRKYTEDQRFVEEFQYARTREDKEQILINTYNKLLIAALNKFSHPSDVPIVQREIESILENPKTTFHEKMQLLRQIDLKRALVLRADETEPPEVKNDEGEPVPIRERHRSASHESAPPEQETKEDSSSSHQYGLLEDDGPMACTPLTSATQRINPPRRTRTLALAPEPVPPEPNLKAIAPFWVVALPAIVMMLVPLDKKWATFGMSVSAHLFASLCFLSGFRIIGSLVVVLSLLERATSAKLLPADVTKVLWYAIPGGLVLGGAWVTWRLAKPNP